MRPFSKFRYPDRIRIQRVRWEDVQGTPVARYDTAIEPALDQPAFIASVQSAATDRTDPEGRITTVIVHKVFTPVDHGFKVQDHILWTDKTGKARTITTETGSLPKGIGDVIHRVECVETN
jgi:hypothetical protein